MGVNDLWLREEGWESMDLGIDLSFEGGGMGVGGLYFAGRLSLV